MAMVIQNIYGNYDNRKNINKNTKFVSFKSNLFDRPKDNEKFTPYDASKYFIKGLGSAVTTIFESPKNFVTGLAFLGGITAAMILTQGALAPMFIAMGLVFGTYDLLKGASTLYNARDNGDKKKAFYYLGAGTSDLGLSLIGAKASLKEAGIPDKEISMIQGVKKTVKTLPDSINKTIKSTKEGLGAKKVLAFIKNPFLSEYRDFSKNGLNFNDGVELNMTNQNLAVHGMSKGELRQEAFNLASRFSNDDDKKKKDKTYAPFLSLLNKGKNIENNVNA